MPRAKPAQRVAAANVTASLAAFLSPARAEASRKNGAKSQGPKTREGKARSARNALRHGLRAEKHVVVAGESAEAFAAFEAALVADLAPAGALQALLAGRIARAAWRLERAERIETELFAREMHGLYGDGDLGLALIRDGNGARAFDTLLRYRGAAQAELCRALRLLNALQAERAAQQEPMRPTRGAGPAPRSGHAAAGSVGESVADPAAPCVPPIEPGCRTSPGESLPAARAHEPETAPSDNDAAVRGAEHVGSRPCPPTRMSADDPKEPEARSDPGEPAPGTVPDGKAGHPGRPVAARWTSREAERASDLRRRCGA
ncbi:MAG TPA: hypothetical protein VFV80_07330 [Geminicoccaceae bacterium]|nr:hypothetical protein [Geminicoccaceae bacterium]